MAVTVNMQEAKTQLSRLIERAARGEEVVLARAGKPMVRLTPVEAPPVRSRIGFLKGYGFSVPDDFNEMGRGEMEKMFYGED